MSRTPRAVAGADGGGPCRDPRRPRSDPTSPSTPVDRARTTSRRPGEPVVPAAGVPAPVGRRGEPRGHLRRRVALVAVLAGSALFVSGWSLGRQSALTPGHARRRGGRLPAVLGHVPRGHRALRGRRRRPQGARRGRDQGDDRRARRPVLAVPHARTSSRQRSQGDLGRVRGHRRDDRHGRRRGRDRRPAPTLSARTAASWSSRRSRARRPRRPGCSRATSSTTIDGAHARGPQRRRRPAARSAGPKDTTVDADDPARDERAVRRRDRARRHRPARGRDATTLADGTVGYIRLPGFSDHAADAVRRRRSRPTSRRGEQKLIVDLRGNPGGFVTAARDIASQFLADGPIFWQEDADGNLIETVAKPGGAATDPSIQLVAPRRRRLRVRVRDRRRRAPRPRPGDARRHEDLRQGHGPAVDAARGRQRRLPAHDRQVADAGQDVDPRHGHRARRRRRPTRPPRPATIRCSTPASRCSATSPTGPRSSDPPRRASARLVQASPPHEPTACTRAPHRVGSM